MVLAAAREMNDRGATVWISISAALKLVENRRRLKPPAALAALRQACLEQTITWRFNSPRLDERGRLLPPKSEPDFQWLWCEKGRQPLHPLEEQIEVSESELEKRWPRLPRRGPERGTIGRYNEDDRALFPEMKRIMQRELKSPNEAARELVYEGKVEGRGSDESRALRLARAYRRETASSRLKTRFN